MESLQLLPHSAVSSTSTSQSVYLHILNFSRAMPTGCHCPFSALTHSQGPSTAAAEFAEQTSAQHLRLPLPDDSTTDHAFTICPQPCRYSGSCHPLDRPKDPCRQSNAKRCLLKPLLEGSSYHSTAVHPATPDAKPDSGTLLQQHHRPGREQVCGAAHASHICSESRLEGFFHQYSYQHIMDKGGKQKWQEP